MAASERVAQRLVIRRKSRSLSTRQRTMRLRSPRILHSIENLVPIASQITLGIFRGQFREAIDNEIGEQLTVLSKKASEKR